MAHEFSLEIANNKSIACFQGASRIDAWLCLMATSDSFHWLDTTTQQLEAVQLQSCKSIYGEGLCEVSVICISCWLIYEYGRVQLENATRLVVWGFMHNPGQSHQATLQHISIGAKDFVSSWPRAGFDYDSSHTGFTDLDYARCVDSRNFTCDYYFDWPKK